MIQEEEIKLKLSGGTSNTDPNLSLGGERSSTDIVDNTLNNLFRDTTGEEHEVGITLYRCFFVHNTSSEEAFACKVEIDENTPALESNAQIGLDPLGQGSVAGTISSETTAPSRVTFSEDVLEMGDIPADGSYPVWVKLVITPGYIAQALDKVVIKVSFDTI